MRNTAGALGSSGGVAAPPEGRPAGIQPQPRTAARRSGWTGGRIAAVVTGSLLALVSLGMLSASAVAWWASTQRDVAGYVTTGTHGFSTSGSALATEPIELGSPGVGWLYSEVVLGEVRIRVTPVGAGADLFVGIGPAAQVARYLDGVGQTHIDDFWSGSAAATSGGAPATAPATQGFWVASSSGSGPRTVTWDPANGSWVVVVMNADGSAGVDVQTDLAAEMPFLSGAAVVSLVIGGIFAVVATLLIVGALRRRRAELAGLARGAATKGSEGGVA